MFNLKKHAVLAVVPLIAIIGCGKSGGTLAAVVNDEPLTQSELDSYIERKQSVQVVIPNLQNAGVLEGQVVGSIAYQGLRDLITRRVLLQVAKDEGVFPDAKDIDAELAFQMKRRPDFVRSLTLAGLTLEQIKQDLTVDLAKEHILTKGLKLEPGEVDKYIKDNPKQFQQPEQASLLFILAKDAETKSKVDAELSTGKAFRAVAQKYSQAPNLKQSQGQFPLTVVDQMPKQLQDFVHGNAEGKASGWIKDRDQNLIFYIDKKIAAKEVKVDDTMKTFVGRQLLMARGAQAVDLNKRIREKLKTAKITVQLAQLKEPWDQFMKSFTADDANASTSTSSGQTPQAPKATK